MKSRLALSETTKATALTLLMALLTVTAAAPAAAQNIDCSKSTRDNFNPNNADISPSIDCPALPETPYIASPANAPDQAKFYEDWAWKSFVALNWPAVVPSSSTNPPYARGFPDDFSHFAQGDPDTLPVWGTWKEKRELFSVANSTPKAWNAEVDYFVDYPPCTDGDGQAIAQMGYRRILAQSSKSLINSLDEDVQVPSEAQYPSQVAHQSVQPKVWRHSRDLAGNNAVVYEVKLNYDYYNYVVTQDLYKDDVKTQRAAVSGKPTLMGHENQSTQAISFPWRLTPPDYSVEQCQQMNGNLGPNPCPTGTIQTKSAWVQLTDAEVQSGDYHWTPAQFYRVDPSFPDGICTAVANFGLIGFHVIQKTVEQGFYIYATWEHSSNDTTPFVYANYFKGTDSIPAGYYPAFTDSPNGISVSRQHKIFTSTNTTTQRYHDLIRNVSSDSVWLNYQMTGVQFIPVQCYDTDGDAPCDDAHGFSVGSDDPTNIGQPFYLANLVVETNWGLQNFQGVPPGMKNGNVPAGYAPTQGFQTPLQTKPDDHFLANDTTDFDRSLGNVGNSRRNRGKVFNMGGCMGCHGIAQGNGTDFSFVLLAGGKGADVEPVTEQELTLFPGQISDGVGLRSTFTASDLQACVAACMSDPRCSGFYAAPTSQPPEFDCNLWVEISAMGPFSSPGIVSGAKVTVDLPQLDPGS